MKTWACVFILLCSQELSLGCKWVHYNFGRVSEETLSLLREMGGELVHDRMAVPFPIKSYKNAGDFKSEEKIMFIHEVISHIRHLYSGNTDAVNWDAIKLEMFQLDLHRQDLELDQCRKTMKSDTLRSSTKESKKINRHFKDVENLLKSKDRSHAWEVVRTLVWRHLQRLDLLAVSIRRDKSTAQS
ncbi:IFNA3 protein, partial [Amia calva]|nr:IFNA3 protein [Amia calva]